MEQQDESNLPNAPFPAPPPFWKYFTVANLDKYKEHQSSNAASEQLPYELAFLRPPPPPAASVAFYETFNQAQPIDTTPALPPEDQLLFDPQNPNVNHAVLLTRLTKSILLNFLELTTILSLDPTKYQEKLDDIRRLILNIHAVINMYRPHQAREAVKDMLEEMLEDGEKEMQECDEAKAKIEAFLGELKNLERNTRRKDESNSSKSRTDGNESSLEEAKRLWAMIHAMEDG